MSHATSRKQKNLGRRKIGRWYLGEPLGKGSYNWVQKGYDRKTSKAVALKFMDRSKINDLNNQQLLQIRNEIQVLKQMKHSNIMRLFAYNLHARYQTENGEERQVMLFVLEYLSGGELFDILYFTSKLDEMIARTYFKQLITGLEVLHNVNLIHRDIKPHNLLLDKHFTLKLCDYGLATIMKNENNSDSKGYKAPEILLKQSYTSSCDIFSTGVVLFVLISGHPPFEQAKIDDEYYSNIAKKEYKSFRKLHKNCGISPAAMDLIIKMLHYLPDKRISLSQIKEHNWYLGKTLSQRELTKILKLRHTQMQLKRQNDSIKPEKLTVKYRKTQPGQQIKEVNLPLQNPAPELPLGDSIGILDVFSEKCGVEILEYFDKIVKKYKGSTEIDMENFHITIKLGMQSNDNQTIITKMVELLVHVFYYRDYDCNVVKFHRISGDLMQFREILNFLIRLCRPVLTGVPKKTMKLLELTEIETQYVNRYFSDDNYKMLNLSGNCIKLIINVYIRKFKINGTFPNDIINVIIKYSYDMMRTVDYFQLI